jgi:hypothetical protein
VVTRRLLDCVEHVRRRREEEAEEAEEAEAEEAEEGGRGGESTSKRWEKTPEQMGAEVVRAGLTMGAYRPALGEGGRVKPRVSFQWPHQYIAQV